MLESLTFFLQCPHMDSLKIEFSLCFYFIKILQFKMIFPAAVDLSVLSAKTHSFFRNYQSSSSCDPTTMFNPNHKKASTNVLKL